MITLAILLLLGLALIVFTIISVVVVGSVGFVIFGDIIVAVLIIAWIIRWNGLSKVSESPSGAEATPLYANNHKYLNLLSTEEYAGTIEAYTYPDEFAKCNGESEMLKGVTIGQQKRQPFGFAYRTLIGNDTDGTSHGYKIHLVYGALASPSPEEHESANADPNVNPLSWEFSTTPVEVENCEPTATLEIDSTKVTAAQMLKIEEILYGKDATALLSSQTGI